MSNTWMTVSKLDKGKKFLEMYYYFLYIYKFFDVFFYYKNSLFVCKFINIFFYINRFDANLRSVLSSLITNNRGSDKYLNYEIRYKLENPVSNFHDKNFVVKKYLFGSNDRSTVYLKLFNFFFLFNYSLFDIEFKPHRNYKLFFIQDYGNNVAILDTLKFVKRWKDAQDLLYSVFYYQYNPLLLGSPFFKNEVLALNWNYSIFDINVWKYYFPFFIFKSNTYSRRTDFFFEKMHSLNIDFYLVSDCFYHFKNLHYISKKKYYSIGLVNANVNPWLVTYPIVSFFESFVTQLFFLKLLLYIQKQAVYDKHVYFKNLWFNFFALKYFSSIKTNLCI